jgi:hypothetical protein
MTTNKPIELGKASKETKQMGFGSNDNPIVALAQVET